MTKDNAEDDYTRSGRGSRESFRPAGCGVAMGRHGAILSPVRNGVDPALESTQKRLPPFNDKIHEFFDRSPLGGLVGHR